jgi:hypothetical protein
MSASREDEEFLKLGVQYYVAARYAALAGAGLLPVCGNLYHHALEMFLKSGLSRKHSLQDPKSKKFGHKLIDIWDAFKADFPSTELPQFDTTIADIHDFEEIRYPNEVLKNGAQMVVDWGSIPAQSSASEPMYKLHVNDLDRLIWEIFCASSRNPKYFTAGVKPEVRAMLARENPVAAQLLGN